MSTTERIVIAVTAVAIVAVGALCYSAITSKDTSHHSAKAPHSNEQTNHSDSDSTQPVAATITYNGSTFSLSSNTVPSGSAVKAVNDSSNELDLGSDPHPTHTDNPELNAGTIEPGHSKTFTLTKKGTWGFHNHFDPSQHAFITVK